MVALGATEMAFMLLWLPFVAGVPVGLPPGPEDPVMAQMAPAECLFYATWSPRGAANPNSNNGTEKLLAEPEVQRFAVAFQRELQRALDRTAIQSQDESARLLSTLAPKLVAWVFTETGALAVNDFEMTQMGPQFKAYAVARLGESGKDIPGLLRQLQNLAPPDSVKSVKVKGIDAYRIQVNPQSPEIVWGVAKGYLVAGVGSGSLEQLLDRMNGSVPPWLSALRENSKIERRSSVSYLNVAAIVDIASHNGGEMATRIIDALGVGPIDSMESVTGLDETGFISRTLLRFEGKPSGILSFVDAAPLTKDELHFIPRDSYVALAARIDFSKILSTVLGVAEKIDPNVVLEIREGVREFEDTTRIRLQEDLLDALGDNVTVYAAPSTGGFISGWTATVEIKDQRRLQNLSARLAETIARSGPEGFVPVIKRMTANGEDIEYVVFPQPAPVAPAWCITKNELVIGMFPQTVIGHLNNRNLKESIADHPALKQLWGSDGKEGPLSVVYVDTKSLFSLAYPMLQMGASIALGEARRNGLDLDISILPSSSAIIPHLSPSVGTVRRTAEGLEIVQRQTLPGGSIGASAPVTLALLLPAVQQAREAARRMQSSNNLKQILLAMHNYHDTFNGFPPAYNVDADGKPLLSWRVHILPFIEQQALYQQFHLDEPWDSDHNRKLILQMPQTYRSPRSTAGEGMTTYLTPRNKNSAFPPPDENADPKVIRGIRLADVTDGTSNTIGVVEVNDDHAVTWTQPDDYEYPDDDPLKGLRNTWGQVFQAAFCDGSVQALSITLNADVLKALFTRNGGEAVQFPR